MKDFTKNGKCASRGISQSWFNSFANSPSVHPDAEEEGTAKKLLVTEKALQEITSKYVELENEVGNLKAACCKMRKEKTEADDSLNVRVKSLITRLSKTKSKLASGSAKKESENAAANGFRRSQSKQLSGSKEYESTLKRKHLQRKGQNQMMRLKESGARAMRNINMNATFVPRAKKYNH